MARSRIKLPGGAVVISSTAERRREERNGEVPALMIVGHCFSWWSNERLRTRAAQKERERTERKERWAKVICQSNRPSDT